MNAGFQLVGGSTIGRDHRNKVINNQDSWSIVEDGILQIGIVADGCGSGRHSEIGSRLGVMLLGEAIASCYKIHGTIRWSLVQQHVLAQLNVLVRAMGVDYEQIVEEYFLFTIVGVVIDGSQATFFALGDGTIVINEETYTLGPFPGNQPPYLGYGLLDQGRIFNQIQTQVQPVHQLAIDQLDTFIIASDGIDDLIAHEKRMLPGLSIPIGPITQFYENERYFGGNPELLSRQLRLIGRDWPPAKPEPGLLHDDTTLIVGRRSATY